MSLISARDYQWTLNDAIYFLVDTILAGCFYFLFFWIFVVISRVMHYICKWLITSFWKNYSRPRGHQFSLSEECIQSFAVKKTVTVNNPLNQTQLLNFYFWLSEFLFLILAGIKTRCTMFIRRLLVYEMSIMRCTYKYEVWHVQKGGSGRLCRCSTEKKSRNWPFQITINGCIS